MYGDTTELDTPQASEVKNFLKVQEGLVYILDSTLTPG